ncbi:MAG: hypothetical protein JJU02_15065 [Cryomorphaceae bacterium]|nr:hypothetical protein [Cryomorphaceae bacterium]
MISIKIDAEWIFEPEQVRIQKSTDKEDFGRKGLFRADSNVLFFTTNWFEESNYCGHAKKDNFNQNRGDF